MNKNIVDHIAFATNDTDKTINIFSILGFEKVLFHKQSIEKFGSYITKLQSNQGQIVELVEPHSQQSVVKKILQGHEATIYHSAFLTEDLAKTLAALKAAGAVIITEPMPIPYPATPAHREYKTSHVFHSNVGLFEVTGPLIGASK